MNDHTCVSVVKVKDAGKIFSIPRVVEFDFRTFKITVLKDYKKIKVENR